MIEFTTAKLATSKEKIEICRIGDPLFYGLELERVHQILLMNSGKMKI